MLLSVFQIHLCDMNDGSPHPPPLNSTISCHTEPGDLGDDNPSVLYTGMTASRLMIFASASPADVLVVWDWRVGDVVRTIDFPFDCPNPNLLVL